MKDKILLLGALTESAELAEEILLTKYRVQRCSMVLENVEGMMKILHPDIVIGCQIDDIERTKLIYKWIREKYEEVPIMIITDEDNWNLHKEKYQWGEENTLFTPIDQDELLLKTAVTIDIARSERIIKKKILLVDDNTIVLRNIRQILKDKYDVILAKSGMQAITHAVTDEIDLILLDYEMPEMNGAETFKRLRNIEKYKNTPVIFLTGVSDREKIVQVLKLNPAGYILKPVKQNKLMAVVGQILDNEVVNNETEFDELLNQYESEKKEAEESGCTDEEMVME